MEEFNPGNGREMYGGKRIERQIRHDPLPHLVRILADRTRTSRPYSPITEKVSTMPSATCGMPVS